MSTTRTIKTGTLQRMATFARDEMDEAARTVPLAFSSETPVDRWFGAEILDHAASSVRLGRLGNAGPLLVDHDPHPPDWRHRADHPRHRSRRTRTGALWKKRSR